jgi:outer membrane autotransporter protein
MSMAMARARRKSRVQKKTRARTVNPWVPPVVVVSAILPFEPSLANDACGAHVAGNPVVCDASGNPYDNGIVYDVTADLELLLDSSAIIERASGYNNDGIDVHGAGHTFTIDAADGATISVGGETTDGIVATGTRSIVIESGADITAGFSGLRGWINSAASEDDVLVTQRQSGSIRITEADGAGIYTSNMGKGSATSVSAGRIESDVDGTYALLAYVSAASGGDVTTSLTQTGTIVLNSEAGVGLYSLGSGVGTTSALSAGSIEISGDNAGGLLAVANNPLSPGSAVAQLTGTGTVSVAGQSSFGIWALQRGLGDVSVQSSGSITTLGQKSIGVIAEIANPGSAAAASVILDGAASVATSGASAHAIDIYNDGSGASSVLLQSNAQLTTQGGAAHGINGKAAGLLSLGQSVSSIIEVSGAESIGVNLIGGSDTSVQLEGRVVAAGEYGVGVVSVATSGSAQQVIESTATVSGGWQADVVGTGPTSTHPAAGVLLEAGSSAHLVNRGAVTAGSDRAVVARSADITVDNAGRFTGFVELSGGGASVFNNAAAATFEVRHFADTDGDGVRDTKRVAISDFGSPTSTFNNSSGAAVTVAAVAGESATDASGYYVPTTGVDLRPLDSGDYQLNRANIVQGQLVNLGTFNHAGVIDLRGPSTGNTLVITGAPSAGGAPGNGVFVSNGGSLLLNVVLNEGLAPGGQSGSLADVLIVDGTQLGSGATTITLDRKEGSGASTPGNGILLVEVRNKAQSAPGVFTLDSDYTHNGVPSVISGAYAYSLFHHGTGSDAGDGNWYLRSSVLDLAPPDPVEPPSDPTPPVSADPDPVTPDPDPASPDPDPASPDPDPVTPDPDPVTPDPDPVTPDADPASPDPDPVSPDPAPVTPSPPPVTAPRFQPGVPVYESYSVNLQALNVLPTLQQRVGNRVWGVNADGEPNEMWGRIDGASSRARPATSTSAAEQSADTWKMQVGLDRLLMTSENEGRLVAGIALEYGKADTTVRSIFGDGRIDTEGYGLGTMWTWYGHTGLYVDAQAQVNRYRSELRSTLLGRLVRDHHGRGRAFSLEAGRKVALGEAWSVTPQTQLSYSRVKFDSFTDPAGAVVSASDADSLTSRLGIAINRDSETSRRHSHAYAIANFGYEWENGLRTEVSGTQLKRMERREWAELGFGGSVNWSNGVRLYVEVSGRSPLRDIANSYTVHGTAGISLRF